jgi:hypothetical protein
MKRRSEASRLVTAYHEAGHIVAAHVLGYSLGKATIVPEDGVHGTASHANPLYRKNIEWDDSPRVQRLVEHSMLIAIAGPLAQKRHAPRSHWRKGAQNDFHHYVDLLIRMEGNAKVRDKYQEYVWAKAEALIAKNWRLIDQLAHTLMQRGTMKRKEILEVLPGVASHCDTQGVKNGVLRIFSSSRVAGAGSSARETTIEIPVKRAHVARAPTHPAQECVAPVRQRLRLPRVRRARRRVRADATDMAVDWTGTPSRV